MAMSGARGIHDEESHSNLADQKSDEHNARGDPHEAEEHDEKNFLVDWEPNDPENPHNWSTTYRTWLTFQLSMLALAASSASAIIAPANATIARHFHIGQEVVVLNVSLYVYVSYHPLSHIHH